MESFCGVLFSRKKSMLGPKCQCCHLLSHLALVPHTAIFLTCFCPWAIYLFCYCRHSHLTLITVLHPKKRICSGNCSISDRFLRNISAKIQFYHYGIIIMIYTDNLNLSALPFCLAYASSMYRSCKQGGGSCSKGHDINREQL